MSLHTFVVLAYKESPYLRACLDSVVNQTSASTVIVSTSTPSEFLERLCADYALPLQVNSGPKGLAPDWNFGLRQAQSKYVTLAHQDDLYDQRYVELMVSRAEERADTLITFSDYSERIGELTETGTTNLKIKRILRSLAFLNHHHISSDLRKKALLAFGSPIPCPSVMYNMQNLTDFSFSSNFSVNVDWDAWLRIARLGGSISYVPEHLLSHRLHEHSETSKGIGDNRRADEDLRLFKTLWPRPIAVAIARLYKLSQLGNSVQ
jgi:glycosyltransferase involved in cell wall biosynthesis